MWRRRAADRSDARGEDERLASALAHAVAVAEFRPYNSTDVRGVEIGARRITCRTSPRGSSEPQARRQRRGALDTRGFAELSRFGRAFARVRRRYDGTSASAISS